MLIIKEDALTLGDSRVENCVSILDCDKRRHSSETNYRYPLTTQAESCTASFSLLVGKASFGGCSEKACVLLGIVTVLQKDEKVACFLCF